MPTWSGILHEIAQLVSSGDSATHDRVRRKYLIELSQHTGRATILYASKFTQGDSAPPDMLAINEEDGQGLMEVIHGLTSDKLDLILHSPGGSPVAAEAIVSYLRSKFSHIRVIVPHLAMSAATMMACAADVIVLGKHSFLGPTDPQLVLPTALGVRMVPAHAILQQFKKAAEECSDPSKIGAYLPMLPQYGPDLLAQCRNVCALSEELVAGWLEQYMFAGAPDAEKKARDIAKWLSEHAEHKLHGRHLSRQQLEAKGLHIEHLEADQKLQELCLSLFHATTHTFSATSAVKIIENNLGRAFIKQVRVIQAMPPQTIQAPPAPAATPPTPAKKSGSSRSPSKPRAPSKLARK